MAQIIVLVGRIASGKGTAAAYLQEKHGAQVLSMSGYLRRTLDVFFIEQSRDTLVRLSEVMRREFGEDVLARAVAKDAASSPAKIVVVDGARRLADLAHLKELPGNVLVEVAAEPRARYERIVSRDQNADDAGKTYEQFLADHQRSTETSIDEIIGEATVVLDNNGDLEALQKQLDQLVAQ